ncbi:cache domain-containing protein [Halopseudomonas pelagia]|uniref:cache domain-containing protein n=1 Tax=Halopseudomonas pelagia TaxID=553151 RepID=UPI0030DA7BA8
MARHTPSRLYPPVWVMLTLSTLATLTLGVGLAIFHYQQQSKVILSTGETLFTHISQQIEQDLLRLYQPPIQALNLLALSDLTATTSLQQRLLHLPKLAQVLEDNPQLNSLYHGWPNGDYLMLRPLRNAPLRTRFDAPPQAMWMVWNIQRSGGTAEAVYVFLDPQLQVLAQRITINDGYDPRQRLWYTNAINSGAQIITTPYIFFSTSEFGTTLARPAAGGGVFGADLTLGQLSHTLANLQITEHSQLLLYDPEGTVIAYHDVGRILNVAQGTALRLKRFNELGSTLLAGLAEDGFRQERTARLQMEGQRWTLSQSRIDLSGLPETYLAILVPEQELLAEAYRIRRHSVWITLIASLVFLPAAWIGSIRLLQQRR